MYRKQVYTSIYWLPSSYFLLMFCAQRFTKVKVCMGAVCWLGLQTKGGPPDLI
jgi:hypothetical protein